MEIVHLTKNNFNEIISQKDKKILVDFYASWCGPCKMLAPNLEYLSKELDEKTLIAKINVDEEPTLAEYYDVSSIPTLIVFKDGEIVKRELGYKNIDQLKEMID